MPNTRFIEEYLVSVRPSFNRSEWNAVSGNISGFLNKGVSGAQKKLDEEMKQLQKRMADNFNKRQELQLIIDSPSSSADEVAKAKAGLEPLKQEADVLAANMQGLDKQATSLSKNVASASIAFAALVAAISIAVESAKKLGDAASETSNKLPTQDSVFVDTGVRDIMGKFGVDSTTALGLSEVSSALNISLSDYSKLTQAQRKAFADLMEYYQEGIDSIDAGKLKSFNEAVQEYQLRVVKAQMEVKLAFTKLLAESDAVPRILDLVADSLESISDILASDAFQTGAEILFGIIEGILKFATAPIKLFGGLANAKERGNTTNTVNISTNVNNNNKIDTEKLAVDIGLQVQNALTR